LIKAKDFSRICSAFLDPNIRAGIIDIWLNRDYTALRRSNRPYRFNLGNWQPSAAMRMYIKKDVAEQIWKYGAPPTVKQSTAIDPYQGKTITLSANQIV